MLVMSEPAINHSTDFALFLPFPRNQGRQRGASGCKTEIMEITDTTQKAVLYGKWANRCKRTLNSRNKVRDQEVGGSNPLAPTKFLIDLQTLPPEIRVQTGSKTKIPPKQGLHVASVAVVGIGWLQSA